MQIHQMLPPDGPGALTAARSPVKARPVGSDPAFIRPAYVRWLSVNKKKGGEFINFPFVPFRSEIR